MVTEDEALFDLSEEEASQLARIGSGSAIRSLHGGLVRWKRGIRDDGVDSVAVRVFSPKRWLSLRALIFVVSAEKKETGSTIGMQTTVETSKMLPARVARCDKMIERMQKAFAKRNFPALARLPHSDAIIEEPMSPIQSPASDFSFTDALASHALLGATDETPPLILDLIYSTVGAEPCVIHHQKNSGY
ncbi:unnamed protein product, partial [Mesorhabditis spiculigera]